MNENEIDELHAQTVSPSRIERLNALITDEEVRELLAPFRIEHSPILKIALSERLELATRNLAMFFQEPDQEKLFDEEYSRMLELVATDPARALDERPATRGGKNALKFLLSIADIDGIDPETRKGAAILGDVALKLTKSTWRTRSDAHLTMGEEALFEDVYETIRLLDPVTLEILPSNETVEINRGPVIAFTETFIQMVIDRTQGRLKDPSDRIQKRLSSLLNKTNRSLLSGIRRERQFRNQYTYWEDGEVKAIVLF